jgi:hypothetical protein
MRSCFLGFGSWFLVPGSWCLVRSLFFVLVGSVLVQATAFSEEPGTKNQELETEPFRPEPGKFPPLEKAYTYRGELVFVDHANRRGSLRVERTGKFYRNDPHPFAMLPYGIIRYHGAPADLRDIPLGTVMHVRAFLPPDPKISAVPVLPVNNKDVDAGHYRGTGIAPAENHVLLLEDEPSHCLNEGMVWKLKEVEVKNNEGMIVASREAKGGCRHPHLARPRTDRNRGPDRRRRVARQREKIPRWAGRSARDHLEARPGGWAEWRFHPLSHLGHLAGRSFHPTRLPTSDRDAQGVHPQSLDAGLG